MDLVTITAITSVIGLSITLLLLGGGGLFWIWRLSSRVDHLSYRVDRLEVGLTETREELRSELRETREELRSEMRDLKQEVQSQIHDLREEMRALRDEMRAFREEMREEMRASREEMREEMREMREEMQRNQERILVALAAHSHDEAGQATFRNPL